MRSLLAGCGGIALSVLLSVAGPVARSAESAQSTPVAAPPVTESRPPLPFLDTGLEPAPPDIDGESPNRSSVLRRTVRRFDFEEAETTLVEFPPHFRRMIAVDRGFPRFGDVGISDACAFSGNWSFHFGLDGGSIAAQIPAGVLPVLPLADYAVTARVRTLGLVHARARIVAWLQDATGNLIPDSRRECRLIRTGGAWDFVNVRIAGDHPEAADLLVELQLLQPSQYASVAKPLLEPALEPALEDVSGSAWFDDVTIWHLPRIELSTGSPYNIVVRPERAEIDVLIRDLSVEPLSTQLRITDIDGREVFAKDFPSPRGRLPLRITPPLSECGWYRVELTVVSEAGPIARRRMGFIVLPEPFRRPAAHANGLGVVLPYTETAKLSTIPELVRRLDVEHAVVGVWDERMRLEDVAPRFPALRRMIDDLLATDTELTFSLDSVPGPLARSAGVDPSQVLELLSQDPAIWRTSLDEMLINFGLRVRNWQVGNLEEADAFWKEDLEALVNQVAGTLSQFLPEPSLLIPFVADQEIPDLPAMPGISVVVPYEVQPAALLEYSAPWLTTDRALMAKLEPLPADLYTPRQQVVDLLLRALHGWRAGLPVMAIDAPWRWREEPDTGLEPAPAFAAWSGLAAALGGRRFAGEMPIADDVHCWLMEGSSRDDDALVVWRDQPPGSEPLSARMILADHAVRLVDAFGNTSELPRVDGVHHLEIDDLPVFVEDIDLALARFRAGFALDPGTVPARHQVHEHELVIENPWDIGISGTIRLHDPDGCQFAPRRRDFAIRERESIRIPVTIICNRSIIAGRKQLEADVQLTADREYRLRLHAGFDVGWDGIELAASWSVARNAESGDRDLVITQVVTNRTDESVNLDSFVLAPGTGQNRRVIAALQPGSTVTRSYHIEGGVESLSGKRIRHGVSERDGVAQLNHILVIPDLTGFDPPPRHAGAPEDR